MNSKIIPELMHDLAALGVCRGDCLVVHSSFKALGLPDVSPVDVVRTLIECIGPDGTIMMPTFTYSYSGIWNVRPFNPQTTPGAGNGVLTETLRQYPGALRSSHPTYSVAAYGRHAAQLTKNKENASALGIGSSYDEAIRLGAKILLLGVGNDRNSMLHYAEVAAGLPYNDIPFRGFWARTAVVEQADGRIIEMPLKPEFPACSANFGVADTYLAECGVMREGKVWQAAVILMDAVKMVAAVKKKLQAEPAWLLCDNFTCEPCALRKKRLREKGLI
ncbi:MAG: AAC(3) family N-acetyltransferase [Verrucomicrobia bacterium]|nr:AAC(3) family N-acetyltransferase [Verrucomicrobiota bacterium]MBU1734550.1 AAC(3) family N-acetyltransferase [Verrucomicrobiota bacterium]MBU1856619.1 AAC(3) family N-acetyltransferase [Verrucomicrobiota bacterium]